MYNLRPALSYIIRTPHFIVRLVLGAGFTGLLLEETHQMARIGKWNLSANWLTVQSVKSKSFFRASNSRCFSR